MRFKRRIIQLSTAIIYNCNLSGFFTGRIYKGKIKGVCTPGLNCYSCPGAVAACPLGSLQGAVAKSRYRFPFYVLGLLLLFGIVFGRGVCGFLCPFGLIQELIYKIPTPKIKKNMVTGKLSYLKYLILVLFVVLIPIIAAEPGFCKYICPAGTLEAGLPLFFLDKGIRRALGLLFSWKVMVLVSVLLICILFFRGFCRFLCPLGAIYSFFNHMSFFGVEVEQGKCSGCGACKECCGMDISRVGDRECIQCMECIDVCPEQAIKCRTFFDEKQ